MFTWAEVVAMLKDCFKNKHGKILAIEELQKLKISQKFNTVSKLNAKFKCLVAIAELKDKNIFAVQAYKPAIPADYLNSITGYEIQPDGFIAWYKAAEQIEQS